MNQREIKYFSPEDRRYFPENLQCVYCGNTNAFYIDLKLRHKIESGEQGIIINFDEKVQRIFKHLSQNMYNLLCDDRQIIHCANCGDSYIDNQEALIECCYQMGCPGCHVCGNYIDKGELIDICSACIRERDGDIDEEKCSEACEHYDYGLKEVRDYYEIGLKRLKEDLGYD
jgi:hypothetical protein